VGGGGGGWGGGGGGGGWGGLGGLVLWVFDHFQQTPLTRKVRSLPPKPTSVYHPFLQNSGPLFRMTARKPSNIPVFLQAAKNQKLSKLAAHDFCWGLGGGGPPSGGGDHRNGTPEDGTPPPFPNATATGFFSRPPPPTLCKLLAISPRVEAITQKTKTPIVSLCAIDSASPVEMFFCWILGFPPLQNPHLFASRCFVSAFMDLLA